MGLRLLAVTAFAALISGQAFAAEDIFKPFTYELFTYELCEQSPRQLAASSESDREFNFVTAMCKRHNPDYGQSSGSATKATDSAKSSESASKVTPSRFIRWTVIRGRTEGMPEECRYFYCDLEHYSGSRQDGPSNGWIVTLPRNKGKPDDCKKHYCRSVDTESSTREPINKSYGIKIGSE